MPSSRRLAAEKIPRAYLRPSGPEVGRVLTAQRATIERLARAAEAFTGTATGISTSDFAELPATTESA